MQLFLVGSKLHVIRENSSEPLTWIAQLYQPSVIHKLYRNYIDYIQNTGRGINLPLYGSHFKPLFTLKIRFHQFSEYL